jgi:hypothetical protein
MLAGSSPERRKTKPSECERTGRIVWTSAAASAEANIVATAAMAVTAEHTRLRLVLAGLEGAVRGILMDHRRRWRSTSERWRRLDE